MTSRNIVSKIIGLIIAIGFLTIILLPIVFVAATSLKIPLEIRTSGAIFPQGGITFENWVKAFRNVPLTKYLFNSTVVAISSTLITLLIAIPTIYTVVRFKTGGAVLPSLILGTYVMPPIVVTVPIFAIVKTLELQDKLVGLILIHSMMNIPLAFWLLDSYIRNIPVELEHAAWVDGYSKFDTLVKIVYPLIKPGVLSTGVVCLIMSWNEFLFALILTYSDASKTFPIGISQYIGEHGMQFGEMSAAALAGIIPIYILVFIFSKNLVEGLGRSGLKG
ncbi:MAG: carbohydrate ABC transporter permease [Anaerolineaceae bacterium]|jgi:multiple sugar transport system permease protein|nr:MAG: carbohydrate ABC transporter permease [Anaerolineaceae bacterium]